MHMCFLNPVNKSALTLQVLSRSSILHVPQVSQDGMCELVLSADVTTELLCFVFADQPCDIAPKIERTNQAMCLHPSGKEKVTSAWWSCVEQRTRGGVRRTVAAESKIRENKKCLERKDNIKWVLSIRWRAFTLPLRGQALAARFK